MTDPRRPDEARLSTADLADASDRAVERDGKVLVFIQCEKRARLTATSYADLIEEAARRRADWIERECKE